MTNPARLWIVLAAAALLLDAEDFWIKKPFTEWSEKDASKLLASSPWSHGVTLGGGAEEPGRAVTGGNPAAMPSDNSMTGAAIGTGGPGNPGGAPVDRGAGRERPGGGQSATVTLHVRWLSALPVRQALVISRLGREQLDSEQARKFLQQNPGYYVVAIVGIPPQMAAGISDERLAAMAKDATLLRKGKNPITAESAQKLTDEPGFAFLFPKTGAIRDDDKEVEFVSRLGALELKSKFKLKDMMFGGKLEL